MDISSSIPFRAVAATAAHSSRAAAQTGAATSGAGFAAALDKVGVPAPTPTAFAGALEKVGLPASDATRYAPNDRSSLSHLTPADRELIQASTGFVVSSDGVVQNPARKTVDPFLATLSFERQSGRLEGPVTATYLKDLFAQYSDPVKTPNRAFDPAHLDAALSFMDARDRQRAENPTPRSSFNVGI